MKTLSMCVTAHRGIKSGTWAPPKITVITASLHNSKTSQFHSKNIDKKKTMWSKENVLQHKFM